MPANQPPSDSVLARVAELRAGGSNWEAVATELSRSAETVRKWPALYADRWAAALHDAERRLVSDAGAESVFILRQLLRSKDEKVRRDAARFLIYLRLELTKLDQKSPAVLSPPPLTSEAARLIAFLDGHSDDELSELVGTLFPLPASTPVPTGQPPVVRTE